MHTPRSTAEQRPTDQAAESARVAPYLTHVIRHHGQLTLIPPDNAGRVRKDRREKRPRPERPEEPHFNVGVARTARRSQPGSPARSRRQIELERRREEADAGISIPDYPPPSFEQAIASAPPANVPLVLSTAFTPSILLSTESAPEAQSTRSRSRSPIHRDPVLIPPIPTSGSHLGFSSSSLEPPSPPSPTSEPRFSSQPNDSDSDKSLELVSIDEVSPAADQWERDRSNGLSLPERLAREQARRHAAENQHSPTRPTMQTLQPSCSQLTFAPSRIDVLDSLNDDESVSPSSSAEAPSSDPPTRLPKEGPPPVRPHKKLSSLFPGASKTKTPTSPPSSPTFGSSQLSLPLHFFTRPGSPNKVSPSRGEGFGPKRLFSHKGKEKSVDIPEVNEALDSWELLETSPSDNEHSVSTARDVPSTRVQRKDQQPAETAGSSASNRRRDTESAPLTKRHSLHDRPVPSPVPLSAQLRRHPPPPPPIVAPSSTFPIAEVSNSPTRSCQDECITSSGDRTPTKDRSSSPLDKLKFSPSMIWARNRRTPTTPTTPTTPNHHSALPASPSSVTSYQASGNSSPSTPVEPTVSHADRSNKGAAAGAHHDRAQRTVSPLRHSPTSPIPLGTFPREPCNGMQSLLAKDHTTSNAETRPPLRQVPPSPSIDALNAALARPLHALSDSQPQLSLPIALAQAKATAVYKPFAPPNPSPLCIPSFTNDSATRLSVSTTSEEESLIDLYNHSPVPTHASMSLASATPIQPPSPQSSDAGVHYTGRPLPRPPGSSSNAVIQPTPIDEFIAQGEEGAEPPKYADEGKHVDVPTPKASPGPSRALNLRESSNSRIAMGRISPPVQVSFSVNLPSPPMQSEQVSRSSSSITLQDRSVGLTNISPSPTSTTPSVESSPQTATPVSESQTLGGSSPMRALYSDLTELDVLLSRLEEGNSGGNNYEELLLVGDIIGNVAPHGITPRAPSPPVGCIEVTRRRVTKDGRVKLKLSLLGVSVDRCGICLSQFKDKEPASLLPKCRHAFHERCAGAWLRRGNRSCPICRMPLE